MLVQNKIKTISLFVWIKFWLLGINNFRCVKDGKFFQRNQKFTNYNFWIWRGLFNAGCGKGSSFFVSLSLSLSKTWPRWFGEDQTYFRWLGFPECYINYSIKFLSCRSETILTGHVTLLISIWIRQKSVRKYQAGSYFNSRGQISENNKIIIAGLGLTRLLIIFDTFFYRLSTIFLLFLRNNFTNYSYFVQKSHYFSIT